MDPEMKRELEEIHALAKDNHRLLRDMRRHQMWSTYGRVVIWLIVLASTLYVYQAYLAPFGLPTSADIQKLINSYKAK